MEGKYRVIVTERIDEAGIEYLKENAQVDVRYDISYQELLKVIGEYDAIVVRSVTNVSEELMRSGKRLKVVGRAGNGTDNIDLDAATRLGIIVVNTPEGNIIAAAELTIAHMLAISRNLPQANYAAKNKDFRRNRFKGVELHGKTVGIIGLGRIGSLVATRLKSFGMRVIAYDPYISDERFAKFGAEKVDTLDQLLEQADFITIHTPKTPETIGMIGREEFKKVKKGVRIVNCARGGLIDEQALYEALKDGTVAAAALDVFAKEPSYEKERDEDFDNPLLGIDNVIVTPHMGASTVEAQYNVGYSVAKAVIAALKGEITPNVVNMPQLDKNELNAIKPYLALSEKLGNIYYQVEKEPVRKIEITLSGDVAQYRPQFISMSVLKGLLDPVLNERVNFVNAEYVAKSRGIDVIVSNSNEVGNYTNLVKVRFENSKRALEFAGTVFGKGELRIVSFMGYDVEFEPSEHMVVVKNVDKPGVIGQIGTLLGVSKVNISMMRVSPSREDGMALMVLGVDSQLSKETLSMIKNVDGVENAITMSL
ncbi:phosphoglycerate dehydrogenase [Caldanaerobius polysaccharolyticus]|uniref:phosphoglycerate dehydrogenase n=1 Tax=Caldanaerobius polysaccharolyticus TaxID=44256 RepID=UPI00047EF168|nr:phosphoglycerate dehydrogenase [Caldanaerobius polysaccharolyticus]